MTQKTIAIAAVLMAAALTGIFGTASLTVYAGQSAYAEDDCENQVWTQETECAEEESFGAASMTDDETSEETMGGAMFASDEDEDAEVEDAAGYGADEGRIPAFDPTEGLLDANVGGDERDDAGYESDDAGYDSKFESLMDQ
jgi:hypothetical protein